MKSKQGAHDTKHSSHTQNKSLKTLPGVTILNHHLSTTHPPCKFTLHNLSVLKTSLVNKAHLQEPSFRPGHVYNWQYEKSKAIATAATCCCSPARALAFSNLLGRNLVIFSGTSSSACTVMDLTSCYQKTQDQHGCVAKAFNFIKPCGTADGSPLWLPFLQCFTPPCPTRRDVVHPLGSASCQGCSRQRPVVPPSPLVHRQGAALVIVCPPSSPFMVLIL